MEKKKINIDSWLNWVLGKLEFVISEIFYEKVANEKPLETNYKIPFNMKKGTLKQIN
jgi:hypothetical protein